MKRYDAIYWRLNRVDLSAANSGGSVEAAWRYRRRVAYRRTSPPRTAAAPLKLHARPRRNQRRPVLSAANSGGSVEACDAGADRPTTLDLSAANSGGSVEAITWITCDRDQRAPLRREQRRLR